MDPVAPIIKNINQLLLKELDNVNKKFNYELMPTLKKID